jgi:hypothetical protein
LAPLLVVVVAHDCDCDCGCWLLVARMSRQYGVARLGMALQAVAWAVGPLPRCGMWLRAAVARHRHRVHAPIVASHAYARRWGIGAGQGRGGERDWRPLFASWLPGHRWLAAIAAVVRRRRGGAVLLLWRVVACMRWRHVALLHHIITQYEQRRGALCSLCCAACDVIASINCGELKGVASSIVCDAS